MIAALDTVLTILLAPILYGPVQCRVSEAFTLLPFYFPEAVPGLFIGCVISNFIGGGGFGKTIEAGLVLKYVLESGAKRDKKARELRSLLLTESSKAKEQAFESTRANIALYLRKVQALKPRANEKLQSFKNSMILTRFYWLTSC